MALITLIFMILFSTVDESHFTGPEDTEDDNPAQDILETRTAGQRESVPAKYVFTAKPLAEPVFSHHLRYHRQSIQV